MRVGGEVQLLHRDPAPVPHQAAGAGEGVSRRGSEQEGCEQEGVNSHSADT